MNPNLMSNDVSSLFTDRPNDESLRLIGRGNNRLVYLITTEKYDIESGSHVVKVDRYCVENEQEKAAWNYYSGNPTSKYLVPVEYSSDDNLWVIMPYFDSVEPEMIDMDVYQKLSELGSDISKSDFVKDESGNQMCCDYASIAARTL